MLKKDMRTAADRRWASITTAVRAMLRRGANRIEELETRVEDLEAQLRTERDLNDLPND